MKGRGYGSFLQESSSMGWIADLSKKVEARRGQVRLGMMLVMRQAEQKDDSAALDRKDAPVAPPSAALSHGAMNSSGVGLRIKLLGVALGPCVSTMRVQLVRQVARTKQSQSLFAHLAACSFFILAASPSVASITTAVAPAHSTQLHSSSNSRGKGRSTRQEGASQVGYQSGWEWQSQRLQA